MTTVPFFSIITPSFNQGQYIQQNIESVLNQNYPKFEHIIMDGGSSDTTISILRKYPHLIWKSEPDKGQSDAVNQGILASKGRWIVWINSDDYLLEGALWKVSDFIQKSPEAHFIYSNIIHVDKDQNPILSIPPCYSFHKMKYWWRSDIRLWQPGTVFSRQFFDEIGLIDVDMHLAMDVDFFMRGHRKYHYYYLNQDLVAFRKHDLQKTHHGRITYFHETMNATIRYWKTEDRVYYFFLLIFSPFIMGSLYFIEGLRMIKLGNTKCGLHLCLKGFLKNPLAIFRREHFGFWFRKFLPEDKVQKIKGFFFHN